MIEPDFMRYRRGCGNEECGNESMPVPSPDELLEGEQACPSCGEFFDIDELDLARWIVYLLRRVEWLEQCNKVEDVSVPYTDAEGFCKICEGGGCGLCKPLRLGNGLPVI